MNFVKPINFAVRFKILRFFKFIFNYIPNLMIFELSDKNVLIIGGGTSGRDLVYRFEKVASHVVFSVHKSGDDPEAERALLQSFYKSNVTVKHDVKHFTATGATFFDGSHQEFDIVLFTTGLNIKNDRHS